MIMRKTLLCPLMSGLVAGNFCNAGDNAQKEKQEKNRAEKQQNMKDKAGRPDKQRPRREKWMDTLPGVKEEKERNRNAMREIHKSMMEKMREVMKEAMKAGDQISDQCVDNLTEEAAEAVVNETLLHNKNMLKLAEKNKVAAVIRLKDEMREKTNKMVERFHEQQEKRKEHMKEKEKATKDKETENEGAVF